MRKTHASLVAGAAAIVLLGMLMVVPGCQDLGEVTSTTGSASETASAIENTTTTAVVEASTTTLAQVAAKPVSVTNETGKSPCLIVDAFSQDGTDYVVVDYILVDWVWDSQEGRYTVPKITNKNTKLRTFIVPANATVSWEAEGDEDGHAPEPPSFNGLKEWTAGYGVNIAYGSDWGYWDIKVSRGKVVSLVQAFNPPER